MANPARSWSAEQGKKKKVWQRTAPPPPPPSCCSFGENKIKITRRIYMPRRYASRGPSRVRTRIPGGQSRSWSAEQGKKIKIKSGSAPPPPPPSHCSFGENQIKSRDASTCLGATQVSVHLASVQGFPRLVGLGQWVSLYKILHFRVR